MKYLRQRIIRVNQGVVLRHIIKESLEQCLMYRYICITRNKVPFFDSY